MEIVRNDIELLERMRGLFSGINIIGLDIEIVEVSFEEGTVTIEFDVGQSLANQLGAVQGGIVATMLDACIGIAGAVKSGGVLAMPLAEMKTSYLRPVPTGRVIGKGETLKLGKKLGFIEGALYKDEGTLLATASATSFPVPFPDSLLPDGETNDT